MWHIMRWKLPVRQIRRRCANDGEDRALLSGYSAIVFDEKNQNTFAGGATGGTIVQYQDGAAVPLYPAEHSVEGNTPILPIPSFSER